MDIKRWFEYLK